MSARGLDLTGEWAGVYSYPSALPPVSFSVALVERGGWLSGEIEEEGGSEPGFPKRRGASLQGRRAGLSVTWLKTYAHREVSHDVEYEGAVSADGAEISGRWSIFSEWSGVFLMIRKPQAGRARARRAGAGDTRA